VVIAVAIVLSLRAVSRIRVETPGGSDAPLIGPRVRVWYRGLMAPFEEMLVRAGVSADALTYAQLGVSVLAAAAFWRGAAFLGGWLTILAGTLDILDGGVARRGAGATRRGALVDSVVDRWAEFVTFVGLGALFRDSWLLLVVALAAFGSLMVSYTRARAEGLGIALQQGRAQRPERFVILGFGGFLSGVVAHLGCFGGRPDAHGVLAAAVVLLAILSTWTAVSRARHATALLRESS
jgi:CDP-diacylglycerol--glycerol-3-phosphate 3-phosphatidyltransferase